MCILYSNRCNKSNISVYKHLSQNIPFVIIIQNEMVKLVERQNSKSMDERLSPEGCFLFLCHMTHFPLLGKDKFPLGVEYIFESKFPLVVRIGLAARACGSGNGQSPSNSVEKFRQSINNSGKSRQERTCTELSPTPALLVRVE